MRWRYGWGVSVLGAVFWGSAALAAGPAAVSSLPANGAIGVVTTTEPVIIFSEPLDARSVTPRNFQLRQFADDGAVTSTLTLESDGVQVTFHPAAPLRYAIQYYLWFGTGVKNLAGAKVTERDAWYKDDKARHQFITETALVFTTTEAGLIADEANLMTTTTSSSIAAEDFIASPSEVPPDEPPVTVDLAATTTVEFFAAITAVEDFTVITTISPVIVSSTIILDVGAVVVSSTVTSSIDADFSEAATATSTAPASSTTTTLAAPSVTTSAVFATSTIELESTTTSTSSVGSNAAATSSVTSAAASASAPVKVTVGGGGGGNSSGGGNSGGGGGTNFIATSALAPANPSVTVMVANSADGIARLSLAAANNSQEMLIATDAQFAGARWLTYLSAVVWRWGAEATGTTTVYVKFRNEAGESPIASANFYVSRPVSLSNPAASLAVAASSSATSTRQAAPVGSVVRGQPVSRLDELIVSLKSGERSMAVKILQQELRRQGFFSRRLRPTTYYGVATRRAVEKYLKTKNINS